MNNTQKFKTIFKNGSKTFFFSSIFFPPDVKDKVFTLYAFVRTADDFVDSTPQNGDGFRKFRHEMNDVYDGNESENQVLVEFVKLSNKYFEREWVEAFMDSMESDLNFKVFEKFSDVEKYIYGSADVIGLMMARILKLPQESYECAALMGKAMQLINFIRDVNEDIDLGRIYLPQEDLRNFNVNVLEEQKKSPQNSEEFNKLIRFEIERYWEIQTRAEKGLKYIPKRYLIPIRTASNMYRWTANKINNKPQIIFEKKVKPRKTLIIINALFNTLR